MHRTFHVRTLPRHGGAQPRIDADQLEAGIGSVHVAHLAGEVHGRQSLPGSHLNHEFRSDFVHDSVKGLGIQVPPHQVGALHAVCGGCKLVVGIDGVNVLQVNAKGIFAGSGTFGDVLTGHDRWGGSSSISFDSNGSSLDRRDGHRHRGPTERTVAVATNIAATTGPTSSCSQSTQRKGCDAKAHQDEQFAQPSGCFMPSLLHSRFDERPSWCYGVVVSIRVSR
mmetsp:Transcript_9357/g.20048  ORF Transcript_9357/g.20048 Transcript_9357/m.20048 type:complete len:224 (-) Transcript_9357:4-675(-)